MVVNVKTSTGSYDIVIKKGVLSNLANKIKDIVKDGKVFLVTDQNVDAIYGQKIKSILNNCFYHVLPAGEHTKSHQYLMELYSEFLKAGITREDTIIAFGGGVIGDLVGYASATYLRGVKYIGIPTTLLSQVDSSVGGKVAVNLPQGKNLIGCFYPPSKVIIDPMVLETLPKRVFADGMAEVIKYGAIKDKELFNLLLKESINDNLEQVIKTCVEIKKELVEQDEFDKGNRMLLNFGHTYGHAVECYYNYDKFTHGEAVAIGMLHITKKTEEMGITSKGTYELLKEVLIKYNLYFEDVSVPYDEAKKIMSNDKKSTTTGINYIVLREIGESEIQKEIL